MKTERVGNSWRTWPTLIASFALLLPFAGCGEDQTSTTEWSALSKFQPPAETTAILSTIGSDWAIVPIGGQQTSYTNLDYYSIRVAQPPTNNINLLDLLKSNLLDPHRASSQIMTVETVSAGKAFDQGEILLLTSKSISFVTCSMLPLFTNIPWISPENCKQLDLAREGWEKRGLTSGYFVVSGTDAKHFWISAIRWTDKSKRLFVNPIAGNREFGVFEEKGEWVVYTRGLERSSRDLAWFDLVGSEKSDLPTPADFQIEYGFCVEELFWREFFQELADKINDADGQATLGRCERRRIPQTQ